MRNILLYQNVSDFVADQGEANYVNSIIPGVGYVRQDEGVRYNRKKGPIMKVVYITEYDNETLGISNMSNVYGMTVNGEPWEYDDEHPYIAHTPGEYVVEIELDEGTTFLCGSIYGAHDMYVPEGITSICGAFTGSGTGEGLRRKLYLPSTIQTIGDIVESSFGCWWGTINEITCLAPVAPDLQSDYEFFNVPSAGTLYRPAGSDYSNWFGGNHLPNTWTEEDA